MLCRAIKPNMLAGYLYTILANQRITSVPTFKTNQKFPQIKRGHLQKIIFKDILSSVLLIIHDKAY